MITNIINPAEVCYFEKPMDIFSAFMFLRYAIDEEKIGTNDEYSTLFQGSPYSSEILKKISDIPVYMRKTEQKLISNRDLSKLFFNTGKLMMMCISQPFFTLCFNSYSYEEEVASTSIGLVKEFDELSYSHFNKMIDEFSKDKSTIVTQHPLMCLSTYFDKGIECFNHAEILGAMNTAIIYTVLGAIMESLDNDQINDLFAYGDDNLSITGTAVIDFISKNCKFSEDKMYNILQLCFISDTFTSYLEKSIGITFDDKFSSVLRSAGKEFGIVYDKRNNITPDTDLKTITLSKMNTTQDRMVALFREVLKPTSPMYVGDHSYDWRFYYRRYLLRSNNSYNPPMVEFLKGENNLDYSNLIKYTAILDAHAYERIAKVAVIEAGKVMNPTSDKEFVTSWFKLKYVEKLIDTVYKYWNLSKTPFLIDGVDPLCVDVETPGDSTVKKVLPITKVPYTKAYERASYIIDAITARYYEAMEFMYSKKFGSPFETGYFKRLNEIDFNDLSFDNLIDAVRDNQYMKVPYIVSVGAYDYSFIRSTLNSTPGIDFNKLIKLNVIDTKYSERVIRSPFQILRDGNFNSAMLDGDTGENIATGLREIITGLTNYEYLYLISRED